MPRDVPETVRLCWTDPVTGQAQSVPIDGALRLGSNRQQNDVVLPLRSVEPFHAEILGDREGGWELVALGPRRLKVNDAMAARARLTAGTEFSVGPVAFRVRPCDPRARRPVSSTGSRHAFVPPPPPPPRVRGRGPAVAGIVLVAAVAATWSAVRSRPDGTPGDASKTRASSASVPDRGRPKAKAPESASRLEAGSVVLAPAGAPRDAAGAADASVLVKIAGAWVPVRGFFVTAGGLVVTNHRLAAAAESIVVRPAPSGAPVPARLVASDAGRDLALLEAPVTGTAVAALDDEDALRAAARSLGVPSSEVRAFVAAHR